MVLMIFQNRTKIYQMARTVISYSRKDYLKSFKKKNPDLVFENSVFKDIIDTAGTVIGDILLEDGEIKLPSRLGVINIRKFHPKGKGAGFVQQLDKHKSRQQKKAVYQFNDHTGGFIYRFFWNKKVCKGIADKNMWVFKAIRSLKRKLAQVLKQKVNDFPILSKDLT